MLRRDFGDKACIGNGRHDFLAIADNARIAQKPVDILIRIKGHASRVEAVERRFKPVPFRLDHLPDKAGLEDAAGHQGEPAIIRDIRQFRRALGRGMGGQPGLQVGMMGPGLVLDLCKGFHPASPAFLVR